MRDRASTVLPGGPRRPCDDSAPAGPCLGAEGNSLRWRRRQHAGEGRAVCRPAWAALRVAPRAGGERLGGRLGVFLYLGGAAGGVGQALPEVLHGAAGRRQGSVFPVLRPAGVAGVPARGKRGGTGGFLRAGGGMAARSQEQRDDVEDHERQRRAAYNDDSIVRDCIQISQTGWVIVPINPVSYTHLTLPTIYSVSISVVAVS